MASSALARQLLEQACERFRKDLDSEDDQAFKSTSLEEVRLAIGQIERQMAARLNLRNMKRLKPFLDAMDRYSDVMATLCNGTSILPYVWAPMRFIIQTVHVQATAFDKILSAYGRIGTSLPRFSRYHDTFGDSQEVQLLLAFLYEDIIEFHRRAYRLMKRPAWKTFFSAAWARFDHHFTTLVENISKNSDLLDNEVISIDIFEARESRIMSLERSLAREQRWAADQLEAVKKWLCPLDAEQEQKLEWIRRRRCEGTSQWITGNNKFRNWLQRGKSNPIMWLSGRPGSGKSMVSAQIISLLREDPNRKVLFFFCDFHTPGCSVTTDALRTMCAQLLPMNEEIAPFIYEEHMMKGNTPSIDVLKNVALELFATFDDLRLVIDGVDELPHSEHRNFLDGLITLSYLSPGCKLLVSSQETPTISAIMASKATIFIGEEAQSVAKDMEVIVMSSLGKVNARAGGTIDDKVMRDCCSKIITKAEGILLWVRLVLELLDHSSNVQDLFNKIDGLPGDLESAYGKLLDDFSRSYSIDDMARIRRIFGWMMLSKERRPLRKHELHIAAVLRPGMDALTATTMPFPNSLDVCKPFIEEGLGGSVVFIHSTIPLFLLDNLSGPFVVPVIAHHDMAFACVSQLIQSLDLVDEEVPVEETLLKLGQCLLGLHDYAQEHWIDHVLELAERVGGLGHPQVSILCRQVQRLVERHSQALLAQGQSRILSDCPDVSEPRLHLIESFPELLKLVSHVNAFRHALVQQQAEHGLEVKPWDLDSTLFSTMHAKYHMAAQHILNSDHFDGLSQDGRLMFQQHFASSAYTCRMRGCPSSRDGFQTRQILEYHERGHDRQLMCPERSCAYSDIGFPSLKSLRLHHHQWHLQDPAPRAFPKTIRRMPPSPIVAWPNMSPSSTNMLLAEEDVYSAEGYVAETYISEGGSN